MSRLPLPSGASLRMALSIHDGAAGVANRPCAMPAWVSSPRSSWYFRAPSLTAWENTLVAALSTNAFREGG
ncbi:hypothetical protein AB0H12_21660 [Actinosynnema sp. NPDC023794]